MTLSRLLITSALALILLSACNRSTSSIVEGSDIDSIESVGRTLRIKSVLIQSGNGLITQRTYKYAENGNILSETRSQNDKVVRIVKYETHSNGKIIRHRSDFDMDGVFERISDYGYDKSGNWNRTYHAALDGTITRVQVFEMENGLARYSILLDTVNASSISAVDESTGEIVSKIEFTYLNGFPETAAFFRGDDLKYNGKVYYSSNELGVRTGTKYINADGKIQNTGKATYEEGPCKQIAYNSTFAHRCIALD